MIPELLLLSAVIKEAIDDFIYVGHGEQPVLKRRRARDKKDAIRFLFEGDFLETFLDYWKMEIDPGVIRRMAKEVCNDSDSCDRRHDRVNLHGYSDKEIS